MLGHHDLESWGKELMALCTLSLIKYFSMALCFVIELQYSWIRCVFPAPLNFHCVPSHSLHSGPGLTSACPSGNAVDHGGFDCGQSRIRHMVIHQPSLCLSVGLEIACGHSCVGGWNKQLWQLLQLPGHLLYRAVLVPLSLKHRILLTSCGVQKSLGQLERLELAVWFCELCFLKLCFNLKITVCLFWSLR